MEGDLIRPGLKGEQDVVPNLYAMNLKSLSNDVSINRVGRTNTRRITTQFTARPKRALKTNSSKPGNTIK